MKSPIDMYALRAQFAPVLAAGIPALALVYALISWQDLGLSQSVVVVGLPILMFLCSDYARQPGQALEPGIFARLGGKPSTTMLRHRDPSFSTIEKQHFHKVLSAKVDQQAPTPEQEAADPAAADAWYTRAGNWLRENTRGSKYPMVRCENIAYGYRPGSALDAGLAPVTPPLPHVVDARSPR